MISKVFVSFCLFVAVVTPGTFSSPTDDCHAAKKDSNATSYNIADNEQCDKYHVCTKEGKLLERMCDDGFVFSKGIKQCDYPHNVNCKGREKLQPASNLHPFCPRANAFYAFPPKESCARFIHCLGGVPYEKECPEGVIFDDSKGSCIHPDLSRRKDCAATAVLNFTCPNSLNKFTKLKFGDHDRHAVPEDCRKFIICLRDGRPRVAGCPVGTVFNKATGFCSDPKRVKGCEKYYGEQDLLKLLQQSDSVDFNFEAGPEDELAKISPTSVKIVPGKTSLNSNNNNNNNKHPSSSSFNKKQGSHQNNNNNNNDDDSNDDNSSEE